MFLWQCTSQQDFPKMSSILFSAKETPDGSIYLGCGGLSVAETGQEEKCCLNTTMRSRLKATDGETYRSSSGR